VPNFAPAYDDGEQRGLQAIEFLAFAELLSINKVV
jgi:hypothetical protein